MKQRGGAYSKSNGSSSAIEGVDATLLDVIVVLDRVDELDALRRSQNWRPSGYIRDTFEGGLTDHAAVRGYDYASG